MKSIYLYGPLLVSALAVSGCSQQQVGPAQAGALNSTASSGRGIGVSTGDARRLASGLGGRSTNAINGGGLGGGLNGAGGLNGVGTGRLGANGLGGGGRLVGSGLGARGTGALGGGSRSSSFGGAGTGGSGFGGGSNLASSRGLGGAGGTGSGNFGGGTGSGNFGSGSGAGANGGSGVGSFGNGSGSFGNNFGGGAGGDRRLGAGDADNRIGAGGSGARGAGNYRVTDLNDSNSILSRRVIYFAYDQSTIAPEYFEILDAHSDLVAGNPNLTIRLEGHADERGSREYNVALSERRAQAVKQFMSLKGVGDNQAQTVAYGEELPVDPGHNEAAWSKNRRVEIKYIGR